MKHYLIEEPPLLVYPTLAKAIGLNEAIFLQQLHYWLRTSKHIIDDRTWIYNTYEQWAEQFPFWSNKTIRRIVKNLVELQLVVTANHNRSPVDHTKWYTIAYNRLDELEDNGLPESADDLPERADDVVKVTTSRSGQIDQIDLVKVTTSLPKDFYSETSFSETNRSAADDSPKRADEEKEKGEEEERYTPADLEYARIYKLWEQHFGVTGPMQAEMLAELMSEYNPMDVEVAIIKTSRAHARNPLKYVEAVCRNSKNGTGPDNHRPQQEKPSREKDYFPAEYAHLIVHHDPQWDYDPDVTLADEKP